jgi:hypothetical protein
MKVNDIVYGMQTVQIRMPHGVICYQANTGLHPTGGRLLQLYREAITTIADALNAPVLATEEVLAGLPKDAKLLAENDEYQGFQIVREINKEYMSCSTAQHGSLNHFKNIYDEDGFLIGTPHVWHFKSNGCPKTADYLRQFTLDGVRRVG